MVMELPIARDTLLAFVNQVDGVITPAWIDTVTMNLEQLRDDLRDSLKRVLTEPDDDLWPLGTVRMPLVVTFLPQRLRPGRVQVALDIPDLKTYLEWAVLEIIRTGETKNLNQCPHCPVIYRKGTKTKKTCGAKGCTNALRRATKLAYVDASAASRDRQRRDRIRRRKQRLHDQRVELKFQRAKQEQRRKNLVQ
jgi:hypothetical protein